MYYCGVYGVNNTSTIVQCTVPDFIHYKINSVVLVYKLNCLIYSYLNIIATWIVYYSQTQFNLVLI